MAKRSSTKPVPTKATKRKTGGAGPRSGGAEALPAVRVRMYRQGLGDCHLITFGFGGNDERHMLIDFGTLGTNATKVRMGDVIDDIVKVTGGKLELLVATHAHQDHVSGFLSQRTKLEDGLTIEHVWMPWTENASDPLAKQLSDGANALRATIAKAFAMPQAKESGLREKLAGIAGFEGGEVDGDVLKMGDSIARALDVVRDFKGAKTDYHSPGPPAIEPPEIPGFRFYVLGPPRDVTKLQNMQDNPGEELYGLARAVEAQAAPGFDVVRDDEAPFDERFCYPMAQADQFFPDYGGADQRYRRIDDQWLRAVAELAAKLDDFRNNTSLALAIERIGDGRVLLFPADAQEGNWLSWHDADMKWTVKDVDGKQQSIVAADLLQRTVFYKVGHHASHNATAKAKGLEIMRKNNKELTAFIPVDRSVALKRSPPGSWRMPAFALFRELLEACQGRVVRADLGWATAAETAVSPTVEKELLGLATTDEWRRWKASQDAAADRVKVEELYAEYVLQ